jgi:hypothetical protein
MRKIIVAFALLFTMLAAAPAALAQQPVWTIESWEIEPETIVSGGQFDLTITFTNTGTSGADQVVVNIGPGGSFVGLGAGERWGHLGIGATNTTTLQVGVASGMTTGPYSVPVAFTYHGPYGGANQVYTAYVGVTVYGQAPPDSGRPQLVIDEAYADFAGDSDAFDLVLTLHNTGNRTATGITLNLQDNPAMAPAEGGSAIAVEEAIGVDETAEVRIPMVLGEGAADRVTQVITLECTSYGGATVSSQQSVPIELGLSVARRPRLLIDSYATDPESVGPGDTFTLTLNILNVGSTPAYQVFVRLGESAASLGPLAPVGSSNLRYMEDVEGNTVEPITFDMVVDGDAEAGPVTLDVALDYVDERGADYSETQTVSLLVATSPRLLIQFYNDLPDEILVGDSLDLPIEVINIGAQRLNVSTIEVTSDGLDIMVGETYVGPLDAGTSGVLEPTVTPTEDGVIEVAVNVSYLDDLQQPQTYTRTLYVTVAPAEEVESAAAEPGGPGPLQRIWRTILGFFGLATVEDAS